MSAGGFFIQRRNSPQRSIMLGGNSDNCGNYDNDGCGVQNVSGDEDGDDDDDNADDDNEDGTVEHAALCWQNDMIFWFMYLKYSFLL